MINEQSQTQRQEKKQENLEQDQDQPQQQHQQQQHQQQQLQQQQHQQHQHQQLQQLQQPHRPKSVAPEPASQRRRATAKYDFHGEPAFHELAFEAGEEVTVVKEDVGEGWLLAEKAGVLGLVPKTYLVSTPNNNRLPTPPPEVNNHAPPEKPQIERRSTSESTSASSIRSSTSVESATTPSRPLSSFATIRDSLWGIGNRLSWYPATGVEDFIANGGGGERSWGDDDDEEDVGIPEGDRHFIESGTKWAEKIPLFQISVHHPEKRYHDGQEYTIFQITSWFQYGVSVTVERRFSQFQWLHARLTAKFRALILPSLPGKQYSGRFNEEFIERRRRALGVYLNRLVRHPVVRFSDLLTWFLSCEDDTEWRKRTKEFDADKIVGSAFFENVYHSEYNVGDDGDIDTISSFKKHVETMDHLMASLNQASLAHRGSIADAKTQYQRLGMELLRLITGSVVEADDEPDGCLNEEGAWCWKDECRECLSLTKAMQQTAESMQAVGEVYDNYLNDPCNTWLDNLKEYSNVTAAYEPLVDMHKAAHKKFLGVTDDDPSEDELSEIEANYDQEVVRSRCDTVFNVTLAEIERFHDERADDMRQSLTTLLDGQIELHAKILEQLRATRALYDSENYDQLADTPREQSFYQLDPMQDDSCTPTASRNGTVTASSATVAHPSSVVSSVVGSVGSAWLRGSMFSPGEKGIKRGRKSVFDAWGWP